MTQQPRLELLRASWRPSLMWWLVLTVGVPLGIVIASILLAFAYGVWIAVTTGRPMPYLLGGIEQLPWQYIGPGIAALAGGYVMRGRGSGGGQDQRPFAPSPTPGMQPDPSPTPEGGLVNTEGLNNQ